MSAPQVIAVDLGGTKLAAGIVARDGAVAGRAIEPTDLNGEEALLAQVQQARNERQAIREGAAD